MNFKHWIVLENIKSVLIEGLQDLDAEKQQLVVDYIDRWGARAANAKRDYIKINWNLYWSKPENVEKLRDLVADKILSNGDDIGPKGITYIMSSVLGNVMQKNVGFGSRRNMEMSRRMGEDPSLVLDPEFDYLQMPSYAQFHPDTGSQPIKRKVGHTMKRGKGSNPGRAAAWEKYRAEKARLASLPIPEPNLDDLDQPKIA